MLQSKLSLSVVSGINESNSTAIMLYLGQLTIVIAMSPRSSVVSVVVMTHFCRVTDVVHFICRVAARLVHRSTIEEAQNGVLVPYEGVLMLRARGSLSRCSTLPRGVYRPYLVARHSCWLEAFQASCAQPI